MTEDRYRPRFPSSVLRLSDLRPPSSVLRPPIMALCGRAGGWMAKITAGKRPSKRAVRKGRAPSSRVSKPGASRGSDRNSRAIDTVFAAFDHDIRTPLTGILAFSELLATSGLRERARRWVDVLASFPHNIRTPLTGILAFSEWRATWGLGERERRWVAAVKDAAEHLAEP